MPVYKSLSTGMYEPLPTGRTTTIHQPWKMKFSMDSRPILAFPTRDSGVPTSCCTTLEECPLSEDLYPKISVPLLSVYQVRKPVAQCSGAIPKNWYRIWNLRSDEIKIVLRQGIYPTVSSKLVLPFSSCSCHETTKAFVTLFSNGFSEKEKC